MELKLEAQTFNQAPTRSQAANSLEAIAKYLDKLAGAILLGGEFNAVDQQMLQLLTAAAAIRNAQMQFGGGPVGLPQRPLTGADVTQFRRN